MENIREHEVIERDYFLSFNSASGEKTYTGILLFKNEDDFNEYDEITDNSQKLKFLSSAKSLEEYASENYSNI